MKNLAMFVLVFMVAVSTIPFKGLCSADFKTEDIVGIWDFNEASSSIVHDLSGNNNNGTISGATWTEGVFGSALEFDGTDDIVSVPKSASLSITSQITLECWIKPVIPYYSYYPSIITSQYDWDRPELVGGSPGSKHYTFEGELANGNRFSIAGPDLQNGVWYHIVGTYDGLSAKLYINGSLVGIHNVTGVLKTPTGDLRFGDRDSGYMHAYPGIIDEVAIYSRALNGSEIMEHYLAKFPSAPQNLSATIEGSAIRLSWEVPANLLGSKVLNYKVYRGTVSGGETLLTTIGNTTTYLDTNVLPEEVYYYRVSAVNVLGEGALSDEVSIALVKPSEPQNLSGYCYNSKVYLNWQAPITGAVTNYRIYRGSSSGNESLYAEIGNVLSFVDTNVSLSNTYFYKVTAINPQGESNFSNEINVTVKPPQPPTKPLNLRITATYAKVSLVWDPPADDGGTPITNYKIYKGNTSGNETLLATIANITHYTDNTVAIWTEYFYQVSAINSAGEGVRSDELKVLVTGPTPPSEPQNLLVTQQNGSLVLTWLPPLNDGGSAITNYRIYRSTASGAETPFAVIGNITTYTDTNVTAGTTYYYQVSAINAIGEGNKSNEANATAATTPAPPKNLTGYFDAAGSVVRIAWQPPSDTGGIQISGYKVYRGLVSGAETYLDSVSALAYVDATVQFGRTYYYVVRAYNTVGESPASNEISVLTGYLPSQPRFLTASVLDKNVTLTWVMPLDTGYFPITNYRIYRGTEPGNLSLIAVNANITSYTDTLSTGGTYYYAVSAVNAVGEGAKSDVVSASVIGAPGKVRNLTAEGKAGKIVLSWEAPLSDGGSQITNYKVYRGMSPDNLSLLATLGVQYSYTDTNIISGTDYFYAVSAVNGYGEGLLSDVVSAKAIGVPGKAQYLEAVAGNGTVNLSWYPPLSDGGSQIIKYNIYRGLNETNLTKIAEVNTTTYMDKNLKNGVRYYYAVSAENAAGESEKAIVSAVPFTVPGKVLNLRVVSKLLWITLEWSKPTDDGGSNITAYRIYRWVDGENETLLEEVSAGNTTYIDISVEPGKSYHYRVSAVNGAGEGEKSNEITATVETSEAIVNTCILGILLVVIAGIVVVVLLIYFLFLRKKKKQS
ncbi:MAG: fibronectin type III domain-containing protein [Thermoplasmata archaeon]